MPLEISRHQLDDMVAHARDEAPLECCGIIAGTGDRALATYRTRNIDQSRGHYTIRPEDHYRATREIEDVHEWDVLHRVAPAGELRESERVVAFVGLVRAGHGINLLSGRWHCALEVSPTRRIL